MQSIWQKTKPHDTTPTRPTLEGHHKTEVLIIGGGMAGMLCAYLLKESGIKSIVVEGNRIGQGVTANTTGKITAQHGMIYGNLLEKSREKAQLYYQVQTKALEELRRLAGVIPCHFEEKTAYVYTMDDRKKLERETRAYRALGIPMILQHSPPLPFATEGALGMPKQGQFHPLEFLYGLVDGLEIYENSLVTELRGRTAHTQRGTVTAKHIILATHFPMVNIPGLYFLKMYQHRSYVLALEGGPKLEGMYVDEAQNGHSFRNYENLLLLGGGDHRTGKQGGGWEELRSLAGRAYPAAVEQTAWATQDCMSLDDMPYIGRHRSSEARLYVATGFSKWGMTGSMVAAMELRNLIINGESQWGEVLSPQRSMLTPQLGLNAIHAVTGLCSFGRRCTHMGCALKWNPQERTWDCPCHGSRYGPDGRVLDNPAIKRKKL